MQHGSILRDVDFFAFEHGLNALAQSGFAGQLDQEPESFIGDAIFGVVQEKAGGFGGHALAAFGVLRE